MSVISVRADIVGKSHDKEVFMFAFFLSALLVIVFGVAITKGAIADEKQQEARRLLKEQEKAKHDAQK